MKDQTQKVLYRKYRPQSFNEVIGQEHVVDVLQKAIASKKIAHAYLFAGSRGTGKTTIARILANEIGTSEKDLYEMDAASNRKIDDFRELNESVHTLPFDSTYKVYLIDEVHMLTKEAFNAFLKTLEEPPKHVIFILATTEIDKLPDTIVSRCQTYTFSTPNRAALAKAIKHVAKGEKVKIEQDAVELLAILAEGSFRDALGVFQKVLAYSSDKKITREEVEQVTGAPKGEIVNNVLEAISKGNKSSAIKQLHSVVQSGADFLIFQKLLLDKARAVLLLRHSDSMSKMVQTQFGSDDYTLIKECAQDKDSKLTAKVLLALLGAYRDTTHAYISQLPLELALVTYLEEA